MKPSEIRAAIDSHGEYREAILAHMKSRGLKTYSEDHTWFYVGLDGKFLDEEDPKWLWLEINSYDTEDDLLEDYFEQYMEV